MKCPHCEKEIELTWRRYWKAPLGRHTCPHCDERFRMKHSFKYYGTLVFLWVVSLILAKLAIELGATEFQALAVYLCGGAFILLIDRKLDSTWRGTLPLKRKNA